jgi:hypothetical protein
MVYISGMVLFFDGIFCFFKNPNYLIFRNIED